MTTATRTGTIIFTLASLAAVTPAAAFHDCIQPKSQRRLPPALREQLLGASPGPPPGCSGGLCVGMHGGPHEGGPASYPVTDGKGGYTSVSSTMTVPKMPEKLDGICYYIWTDIFFGDMSNGRMNQFVPQLILGNALDGSSGAPAFKPKWGEHKTWSFGAHYFFETYNVSSNSTVGHAAYGEMYEAKEGELIETSFVATPSEQATAGPVWTLTMAVVGDPSRVSTLRVDKPYMGLGEQWPVPTTSWAELNYTNMCVNSCWELYGAVDRAHLPGSGSRYDIKIKQPSADAFKWVSKWDEDEGANRSCAANTISEHHNSTVQHVIWDITVPPEGQ